MRKGTTTPLVESIGVLVRVMTGRALRRFIRNTENRAINCAGIFKEMTFDYY